MFSKRGSSPEKTVFNMEQKEKAALIGCFVAKTPIVVKFDNITDNLTMK